MSSLITFIGSLDTRIKRLESVIGSSTDKILRFISLNEELAVIDYLYIYKKTVNDSFIIGHGIIGVTEIGDRSDKEVLLYEGDGT